MTNPSFTQTRFRFRNDDGNETTATFKAAENTAITQAVQSALRVRIQIDETASRAWTNKTWNLRYSLNGGAYTAVSASTPIQFASSSNFADGDDCTAQLTAATGAFTSNNNGMKETTGGATNSGNAGEYFETEWCLTIDETQVAHGDTINLRVYDGTTAITTYSQTPGITVSDPVDAVLSKTEDDDGKTLSATLLIQATASKTEDNDTLAATIQPNAIVADLAKTEENDGLAADAVLLIRADLGVTEANDTSSADAALAIAATASVTEANDGLSAEAALLIKANAGISEANDSISGDAALRILADLAKTEQDDNLSGTLGEPGAIVADASIAEDPDSISAAGSLLIQGASAVAESDTGTGAGTLLIQGAATGEESDTGSGSGSVGTGGAGNGTEFDTIAADGSLRILVDLAKTEAPDTLSSEAGEQAALVADLAKTEENDSLASSATVPQPEQPAVGGRNRGVIKRGRRPGSASGGLSVTGPVMLPPYFEIQAEASIVEEGDGVVSTMTRGMSPKTRRAIAVLLFQ